jgi:hypothetical protein
MSGSFIGGTNVTAQVSFRVSPFYADLVDRLAAELNISTASFVRQSVEHFAQNVAAEEIGSDLPDQLVAAGKTIRNLPRRAPRAKTPTTLAS